MDDCDPPQPPPCYRCGKPDFEHDFLDVETCEVYVWPGSFVAAWIEFRRTVRAFLVSLLPGR